jgi:MFS family permease
MNALELRSMGTTARTVGPADDGHQIALLVVLTGFVGAMVGLERSVLPLVAAEDFGLASSVAAGSFLAAFGPAKALANLVAGRWSEQVGRRPVLMVGWLVGLPVPLIVAWAPSWEWVIAANALLGVNQGLCWSMTMNLKLDRVDPGRRGWVLGLNEGAGYLGVASAAFVAAVVAERTGLRPVPFLLGLGLAAVGLVVSTRFVREARGRPRGMDATPPVPSLRQAFAAGSWRRPDLSVLSLAGLTTNLTDGVAWAILPLALVRAGADLAWVGVVTAAYPLTWGLGQVWTGRLSDRVGRRPLVVGGLALQAAGIAGFAPAGPAPIGLAAAVALGIGTALTYPTLLAAVGDRIGLAERATAIGVYRFWRDLGTMVGALGAGLVADRFGFGAAFAVAAAVVLIVAGVVARVMAGGPPRVAPP